MIETVLKNELGNGIKYIYVNIVNKWVDYHIRAEDGNQIAFSYWDDDTPKFEYIQCDFNTKDYTFYTYQVKYQVIIVAIPNSVLRKSENYDYLKVITKE